MQCEAVSKFLFSMIALIKLILIIENKKINVFNQ